MQYHHIYHAGNFADVFKHLVLLKLINCLLKKDKPFLYLDTHAGIGRYDLKSEEAQKLHEHDYGIYGLYKRKDVPDLVCEYLDIINKFNRESSGGLPKFYPGSPYIVRSKLRAQDRMLLCELHAKDFLKLKNEFAFDKQVSVHNRDGFSALKAFLPPSKGRALTLIDPAFEDQNELLNILNALRDGFKKYPVGIYAVWYPIKDEYLLASFIREVATIGFKEIWHTEFSLNRIDADLKDNALRKCGMLVVNPPWQFAAKIEPDLNWLSVR